MRILAILATTALASFGAAQCNPGSLTTLFMSNNSGNTGGGIYFDLTVNTTVTITQIDFNTTAGAGINGTLEWWLAPNTTWGLNPSTGNFNVRNPSLWSQVAAIPVTTAGNNLPNMAVLPTPVTLAPGFYGVALCSDQGNFNHAYTNPGVGPTFANNELQIDAGGAQNACLSPTGGVFTPRIFNGTFHYTCGGTPIAVASFEEYGAGCYDFQESFYEDFPNPATSFDLSGMTMRLALQNPTFPSYVVQQGSGNFFTPTSMPLTLAPIGGGEPVVLVGPTPFPIILPDGNGGVTTTSFLEVSENGWVTPTDAMQTISNAADPGNRDIQALLTGAARWGTWHDMDSTVPPAGGGVFFDVDPMAPIPTFYITWLQLPSRGATNANDFQIAFFANGDVEYRWIIQGANTQAIGEGVGGGWPTAVVFSTGGGASDPGGRDLSLTASGMNMFNTDPIDNDPLALGMSARPLLGTAPNVVTSNIPTGGMLPGGQFTAAQLGILLFGQVRIEPGNSLASFGMPGCIQSISFDITASVFLPAGATSNNFAFPIPNSPSLNGAIIHAQAGTLSPMSPGFNPLGGLSSNGMTITLGTL